GRNSSGLHRISSLYLLARKVKRQIVAMPSREFASWRLGGYFFIPPPSHQDTKEIVNQCGEVAEFGGPVDRAASHFLLDAMVRPLMAAGVACPIIFFAGSS